MSLSKAPGSETLLSIAFLSEESVYAEFLPEVSSCIISFDDVSSVVVLSSVAESSVEVSGSG